MKISDTHKFFRKIAISSSNLGLVYMRTGNFSRAERYLQQALKNFQKIGAIQEQAVVLANLGNFQRMQERFNGAIGYYEKSLELFASIGDQYDVAISQSNIAIVFMKMSDESLGKKSIQQYREKALFYYLKSLDNFKSVGAQSAHAKTLFKIAYLFYQWEDMTKAAEYLRDAISRFKSLGLRDELDRAERFDFIIRTRT